MTAPIPALLGLLALLATTALPPVPDHAPVTQADPTARPVLGTIEATVDGEARRWYVLAGEASDGFYASAIWLGEGGEDVTVVVGGLDRDDVPIEHFRRGTATSPASLGDYDGSVVNLAFPLPSSGGPGEGAVGPDDGFMVTWTPTWDENDMLSGTWMSVDGALEVAEGRLADGTVTVRGTFHATLSSMSEDGTVTLTDGRFELSGAPHVDAITPGG